jgi:hypothetical protein
MSSEIRRRLEDDSWDLRIAGAVLQKKRQRRSRLIAGLSMSSLAAAASLIVITTAVLDATRSSTRYNAFISQQIEGTYHSVFASAAARDDHSPDDDILSMQAIDLTIDETLAIR